MRYSGFTLIAQALKGHTGWQPVWRDASPKSTYDVLIIGGGGHGLATAFYLAENHGIRNVAVLEKGYVGGGNVGRNTTIIRSNYLLPANTRFYEHSMKLWENLSHDLNYNVMFSQRGMLITAHSADQFDAFSQRANIMRLNGIDAQVLDGDE
ncbi:MAG: FAD-dependent oxidoreductase, partial [Mesorhizobium sp.]